LEHLEIAQPLACTQNCIVSVVKIPYTSSTENQIAGSTLGPARADISSLASRTVSSSSRGPPSAHQGVAKSYRKANLDKDEARQVELEIKLHWQLSACSPNVVPFWAAFDSLDSTTILTAHCECDMRSTLEQAGGALSEAAVQQVAAPLLEALVHMHRLVGPAVSGVGCACQLAREQLTRKSRRQL
jgi:hypothetical protein